MLFVIDVIDNFPRREQKNANETTFTNFQAGFFSE